MSRLLKIIGLFCKRVPSKRLYSAKETYTFKEPTNRSHLILGATDGMSGVWAVPVILKTQDPWQCCSALQCVAMCCSVLQCVAVRCSALQCVDCCGYCPTAVRARKLQNDRDCCLIGGIASLEAHDRYNDFFLIELVSLSQKRARKTGATTHTKYDRWSCYSLQYTLDQQVRVRVASYGIRCKHKKLRLWALRVCQCNTNWGFDVFKVSGTWWLFKARFLRKIGSGQINQKLHNEHQCPSRLGSREGYQCLAKVRPDPIGFLGIGFLGLDP